MTVFFTADTHFGDHPTINIPRRPFATTAEMDAAMIAHWNAVVGVDDVVNGWKQEDEVEDGRHSAPSARAG